MSNQQVNYEPEWPRRWPVFTLLGFGAAILAFFMTVSWIVKPHVGPLYFTYLPAYARSAFMTGKNKYQIAWLSTPRGALFAIDPWASELPKAIKVARGQPRLFLSAQGQQRGGKFLFFTKLPIVPNRSDGDAAAHKIRSEAEAFSWIQLAYGGRAQLDNKELHLVLKYLIFHGASVYSTFVWPLTFSLFTLIIGVPLGIRADSRFNKRLRKGRRLRGPELVTAGEFRTQVKGDGIGFLIKDE